MPDDPFAQYGTVGGAASQTPQYYSPIKSANLTGMAPQFMDAFTQMAQDYYQQTGKPLTINDAFRSHETQAAAYKNKPNLAAPPGHSLHERGMAMDIDEAQANELDKLGLFQKHGFYRPMMTKAPGHKYEPWHIQLQEAERRAEAIAAKEDPFAQYGTANAPDPFSKYGTAGAAPHKEKAPVPEQKSWWQSIGEDKNLPDIRAGAHEVAYPPMEQSALAKDPDEPEHAPEKPTLPTEGMADINKGIEELMSGKAFQRVVDLPHEYISVPLGKLVGSLFPEEKFPETDKAMRAFAPEHERPFKTQREAVEKLSPTLIDIPVYFGGPKGLEKLVQIGKTGLYKYAPDFVFKPGAKGGLPALQPLTEAEMARVNEFTKARMMEERATPEARTQVEKPVTPEATPAPEAKPEHPSPASAAIEDQPQKPEQMKLFGGGPETTIDPQVLGEALPEVKEGVSRIKQFFKGAAKDAAWESRKGDWLGERELEHFRTKVRQMDYQDAIIKVAGETHIGPRTQKIDELIHLYMDSLRDPESLTRNLDKLTPEQQAKALEAVNLPTTHPELKPLIEQMRADMDALGQKALDAKVIKNVLENHVNRVWDLPPEGSAGHEAARKFGTTTRHAKERVFPTIFDGWGLGYNLKIKGSTNNLRILEDELNRAIADKKMLQKGLKDKVFSQAHKEGYEKLDHPNMKNWKWVGKVSAKDEPLDVKYYGRKDVYITPEGDIYRREDVYAPAHIAKNLNNILGKSSLYDIPGVEAFSRLNAQAKRTVLTLSLFHPRAFTLSYVAGSLKPIREMNPLRAYHEGMKAIRERDPKLETLVKNGMTLWMRRDWEDPALLRQGRFARLLDSMPATREPKEFLVRNAQRLSTWIFDRYGASLKTDWALKHFDYIQEQHPEMSPDQVAKEVAAAANDNFGGLNLERKGRKPIVQHLMRMLWLAPDWTESNLSAFSKMADFREGSEFQRAFFKKFWAKTAARILSTVVASNIVMSMFDDKTNWERFKLAWDAGNLRWLDVDMTPLVRLWDKDPTMRHYFRVGGHMLDPLRMMDDPFKFFDNKGSVFYRMFHEMFSGVNWKGDPFTTVDEVLGLGDPDKSHLMGQFTKRGKGGGVIKPSQVPSFLGAQARGILPIPVQNMIGYIQGEVNGYNAITKSIGGLSSSVHIQSPAEKMMTKMMTDKPMGEMEDVPLAMNKAWRKFEKSYREGDQKEAYQVLKKDMDFLVDSKQIARSKIKPWLKRRGLRTDDSGNKYLLPEAQVRFDNLSLKDELKVYKIASDSEKKIFRPILKRKISKLKDDERAVLRPKIREALGKKETSQIEEDED